MCQEVEHPATFCELFHVEPHLAELNDPEVPESHLTLVFIVLKIRKGNLIPHGVFGNVGQHWEVHGETWRENLLSTPPLGCLLTFERFRFAFCSFIERIATNNSI